MCSVRARRARYESIDLLRAPSEMRSRTNLPVPCLFDASVVGWTIPVSFSS